MSLGNYETIQKRYQKAYVRDEQLRRYWMAEAITDEQYIEIYQTKYPNQYPEGLEPVAEEPEELETVVEETEENEPVVEAEGDE